MKFMLLTALDDYTFTCEPKESLLINFCVPTPQKSYIKSGRKWKIEKLGNNSFTG